MVIGVPAYPSLLEVTVKLLSVAIAILVRIMERVLIQPLDTHAAAHRSSQE